MMSHATVAASADTFKRFFAFLRDRITYANSGSTSWGPFTLGYAAAVRLADGDVTLDDDGTIEIVGLKAIWETLTFGLDFTVPELGCLGGWCIISLPFVGCLLRFPRFCIGGNVVSIHPNLSGAETKVLDFKADLRTRYRVDPARALNVTDVAAELAGTPNTWQIFVHPDRVLIEPIDVSGIGNIVIDLVNAVIDDILGPLPDWAKGLVHDILAPIEDIIKAALGIVDDIDTWFQNLLGSLDVLADLETALAQYFAARYPLYEFPDPYPILPGEPTASLPVFIPLRNLAATVNSAEMVATVDVGPA